jgi:hypothetical protein
MPLPFSGQISVSQVIEELGLPSQTQISFNNSNFRNLFERFSTGSAISMSNGFGKSNEFIFTEVISSNLSNYNLRTRAIAAGWNGTSRLIATVTINSGVVISGTNSGSSSYAFTTGTTSYFSGSSLTLVNNGTIVGRGGNGSNAVDLSGGSGSGQDGSHALFVNLSTNITNNGTIAGGGGGGGGGGWITLVGTAQYPDNTLFGGGGGGGGRTSLGADTSGGTGLQGTAQGGSGGNGTGGTFNSAGTGGSRGGSGSATNIVGVQYTGTFQSGSGGDGGNWGASGGSGGSAFSQLGGSTAVSRPGGAGGRSVTGNSNITWIQTGTRLGVIQ